MNKKKIAIIIGTRPEAIKMAPVVYALKQRSNDIDTVVIATAQHRQMLDQVLSLFNIVPDIDLDLMKPNQSLNDLTCRVLTPVRYGGGPTVAGAVGERPLPHPRCAGCGEDAP